MDLSSFRRMRDQAVQSLEEEIIVHKHDDGSLVNSKGNFQAQERRVFLSLNEVDKVARGDLLERPSEPGQLWKVFDVNRQKTKACVQIDKLSDAGDIIRKSENPKYDLRGAQIAGGIADSVQGNQYGGTINNYGSNANDIIRLLSSLSELSQAFPEAQQQQVQVHLQDLAADLKQPEKCSPTKLKTRLAGLFGVIILLGGGIATATDFANNVLELSEKLNVSAEEFQPELQQIKQIYPNFDWQN